mgnify:CR=1 FL=1|jgi:hypothetical protein
MTPELAPKFSRYAYKVEDDQLIVIVDTELARLRLAEPYIPLDITIANKGLYSLTLTRSSFVLIDVSGEEYPLAEIDEVQQLYGKLVADSRYSYENLPLSKHAQTSFNYFGRQRCNFFPWIPGAARVTDVVIMPIRSYIYDRLYFRAPPRERLTEILRLRVEAPELEYPLEIAFQIGTR